MKKTLISTTIAIVLSFSANISANDNTDDWEKELNKVSQDFSNLDVEMSDLSTLLADSGATDVEESKDVKAEAVKVAEVAKTDKALEVDITETVEEVVKVTKVEKEEPIKEEVLEVVKVEPPVIQKEIMADETDYVFLRNIPEGTRFRVDESYTVLPKKKFIIFSEGKRVMKTPQSIEAPETQFCFIELVNSGSARILKKGKKLTVTGNKTEVKEYNLNKSYGEYILRTYQTVFAIDNPSVKNFTCYLSETYQKEVDSVPRPLTLKNLRDATGGVFKISFPAYEEI